MGFLVEDGELRAGAAAGIAGDDLSAGFRFCFFVATARTSVGEIGRIKPPSPDWAGAHLVSALRDRGKPPRIAEASAPLVRRYRTPLVTSPSPSRRGGNPRIPSRHRRS